MNRIFWLKSYKLVTQPAPAANPRLWGTDKLIDGWLALAILVVVLWLISFRFVKPKCA